MASPTILPPGVVLAPLISPVPFPPPPCNKGQLLNWETDNVCILTEGWNTGQDLRFFILTCVCVTALAVFLEFLRMTLRYYDDYLFCKHVYYKPKRSGPDPGSAAVKDNNSHNVDGPHAHQRCAHPGHQHPVFEDPEILQRIRYRPSPLEQLVRTIIFTLIVANAYLLVLIAMSFNGFIILSILVGSLFGFFGFQWVCLSG
ncbi:Ctr copper transporter [Naviculisporaceae sp. PSN 640]